MYIYLHIFTSVLFVYLFVFYFYFYLFFALCRSSFKTVWTQEENYSTQENCLKQYSKIETIKTDTLKWLESIEVEVMWVTMVTHEHTTPRIAAEAGDAEFLE